MIKTKDLNEYLNNGWVKGNYYNKGRTVSEKHINILKSLTGEKSQVFDTKFIYKDGENKMKRVKNKDLDKWINDGWIIGITKEASKNLSKSNSGEGNGMFNKCFINNGETNKGINKNELTEWLDKGWILGRLKFNKSQESRNSYRGEKNGMFGKIFIHDENNKNQLIKKDELNSWLDKGWIYGKITNKNV